MKNDVIGAFGFHGKYWIGHGNQYDPKHGGVKLWAEYAHKFLPGLRPLPHPVWVTCFCPILSSLQSSAVAKAIVAQVFHTCASFVNVWMPFQTFTMTWALSVKHIPPGFHVLNLKHPYTCGIFYATTIDAAKTADQRICNSTAGFYEIWYLSVQSVPHVSRGFSFRLEKPMDTNVM